MSFFVDKKHYPFPKVSGNRTGVVAFGGLKILWRIEVFFIQFKGLGAKLG
jgi:hypothetical protein